MKNGATSWSLFYDKSFTEFSVFNLALCLHQDGKTREAISFIERALESLEDVEGTIKHTLSEKLKKWKEELIIKQEP